MSEGVRIFQAYFFPILKFGTEKGNQIEFLEVVFVFKKSKFKKNFILDELLLRGYSTVF
jgi:hypothetical protein